MGAEVAAASPAISRGRIWTERTVAWYERANARSDYAARVLAAAADLLTQCRSTLDVGAGFGALALPLARRLERVTALEPSPAMAAALRRAVIRRSIANLTVVEAGWGEVPMAIVVTRPGMTVSPQALIAFCEDKLARYKIPKSVQFADTLPRNAAGKVLKRLLRERINA